MHLGSWKQLAEQEKLWNKPLGQQSLQLLSEDEEQIMINNLSRYPEVIQRAAGDFEPHQIANYLRELAQSLHSYYNKHQFIVEDDALRNARLTLIAATQQVLANGLKLLGVTAPEVM